MGSVERCERNVSIDNIERLAKALGTSPSELLKEELGASAERVAQKGRDSGV